MGAALGNKLDVDPNSYKVVDGKLYLNVNANAYFEATVHADLADLYAPFLAALPTGAHVLDAGCGSGRDNKITNLPN